MVFCFAKFAVGTLVTCRSGVRFDPYHAALFSEPLLLGLYCCCPFSCPFGPAFFGDDLQVQMLLLMG
jgi:hypothetical protein